MCLGSCQTQECQQESDVVSSNFGDVLIERGDAQADEAANKTCTRDIMKMSLDPKHSVSDGVIMYILIWGITGDLDKKKKQKQ